MASADLWNAFLTVEPRPASVREARRFVGAQLLEHELVDLVDVVSLVASELTTNAVRYARSSITVRLEGTDLDLRLSVSDDSPLNPIRCQPSELDTRGRGLGIVDSVSQAWGVVDGVSDAKSVWASFAVVG
jgi:anti-sigma regulatory factor (Ser/Thr protein kinase)